MNIQNWRDQSFIESLMKFVSFVLNWSFLFAKYDW